jgi:hypothetical protein
LAIGGLAACDTGGSNPSVSAAQPGPTLSAALVGDVPQSKLWIDRPDLPLDYYTDLVTSAQLRMSDIGTADGGLWEVQQQESIAACMKSRGFEYYPSANELAEDGDPDIRSGDRRLWVPWLPDDLASVERYGYGYSDPAQGVGNALSSQPAEVDPNQQFVASLSPEAQRKYQVALLGEALADYVLAGADINRPVPELGGCTGDANEAHPQPFVEAMKESPTTAFQDLIDQIWGEAGDPYAAGQGGGSASGWTFLGRAEVDDLDAEWRECFLREFPVAQPNVPKGVPVSEAAPSEFNGPAGARDLAFHTNAEGEPWNGPSGEAPPEYSSLTGTPREIAIAVADFTCRDETNYVSSLLKILRQAQEEFIGAHQAELDELAAALEQYVNGG